MGHYIPKNGEEASVLLSISLTLVSKRGRVFSFVPFLTHFREVISFLISDFGKLKVEEFVRGILNTNYRLPL